MERNNRLQCYVWDFKAASSSLQLTNRQSIWKCLQIVEATSGFRRYSPSEIVHHIKGLMDDCNWHITALFTIVKNAIRVNKQRQHKEGSLDTVEQDLLPPLIYSIFYVNENTTVLKKKHSTPPPKKNPTCTFCLDHTSWPEIKALNKCISQMCVWGGSHKGHLRVYGG